MSEFFGSPIGTLEGERSQQSAMLNTLQMQEMGQRINQNEQMNPLLLQEKQAAIKKSQLAMQSQQAMIDAMKRADNGDPVDPAEAVEKLGAAAFAAGNWKTGMDAYAKGSAIRRRAALNDYTQQEQQKAQLESGIKFLDILGRRLPGATDQGSWDQIAQWMDEQTGSHYSGTPYDPDVVKHLQDQTLSTYQKGQLALRESENQSKDKNRQSAEDFRAARQKVMEANLEIAKQREARLAKNGGKSVSSPTQVEMDQASNLIKGDKPDAADSPTELQTASFAVASRAKMLRKENPALDPDEATRRAWEELKANWTTISKPGLLPFIGGGEETKFLRGPGSVKEPLEFGASSKESDLVLGKYYKNGKGDVARWNGKQFVPVGKGDVDKQPLTGPDPEVAEPDDEEDDTE